MSLTYPFHQPPKAFTYEELNRDFYETVERFMRVEVHPWVGDRSLVPS
jgi:hypothetical protein